MADIMDPTRAAQPSLAIDLDERGEVVCARLHGYVDAETAPQLDEELQAVRARNVRNVVVDFSDVTHLSSQGVAVLMRNLMVLRDGGGDLRLAGLNPRLREILLALAMVDVFQSHPDAAAAIASFGA